MQSPATEPDRELFEGLGLGIAGGIVANPSVSPAATPAFRFSWGPDSIWAVRLSFIGPAVGARLESSPDSATIRQELAAFELAVAPSKGTQLAPIFTLGAGVFHLHTSGSLAPPRVGRTDQVWSALFSAGAGAAYRLTSRTALVLELQALLLAPRPTITIDGNEVGSLGRPTILGTLGVVTTLL
jgi:hypothetical protein